MPEQHEQPTGLPTEFDAWLTEVRPLFEHAHSLATAIGDQNLQHSRLIGSGLITIEQFRQIVADELANRQAATFSDLLAAQAAIPFEGLEAQTTTVVERLGEISIRQSFIEEERQLETERIRRERELIESDLPELTQKVAAVADELLADPPHQEEAETLVAERASLEARQSTLRELGELAYDAVWTRPRLIDFEQPQEEDIKEPPAAPPEEPPDPPHQEEAETLAAKPTLEAQQSRPRELVVVEDGIEEPAAAPPLPIAPRPGPIGSKPGDHASPDSARTEEAVPFLTKHSTRKTPVKSEEFAKLTPQEIAECRIAIVHFLSLPGARMDRHSLMERPIKEAGQPYYRDVLRVLHDELGYEPDNLNKRSSRFDRMLDILEEAGILKFAIRAITPYLVQDMWLDLPGLIKDSSKIDGARFVTPEIFTLATHIALEKRPDKNLVAAAFASATAPVMLLAEGSKGSKGNFTRETAYPLTNEEFAELSLDDRFLLVLTHTSFWNYTSRKPQKFDNFDLIEDELALLLDLPRGASGRATSTAQETIKGLLRAHVPRAHGNRVIRGISGSRRLFLSEATGEPELERRMQERWPDKEWRDPDPIVAED